MITPSLHRFWYATLYLFLNSSTCKDSKALQTLLDKATYEFVNELNINEALSLRMIML